MAKTKWVAVVQCEVMRERCSGADCAVRFAGRRDLFAEHDSDVSVYIPITCGGCPGRRVARLAAHLKKHMAKNQVTTDEVVVHLSSCIVNDNHHGPPCPHIDDIKLMLARQGFTRLIEGSKISSGAEKKRATGVYKNR